MHVFVVFNFVSYILFDLVKTCSFLSLVLVCNFFVKLKYMHVCVVFNFLNNRDDVNEYRYYQLPAVFDPLRYC